MEIYFIAKDLILHVGRFLSAGSTELYRHEPFCVEDDKYEISIEKFEKSAVTNFSWLWD